jgi:hypothetical protein
MTVLAFLFIALAVYSVYITLIFAAFRTRKFDGKLIKNKYDNGDVDYILRVYEIDKLDMKDELRIKVEK